MDQFSVDTYDFELPPEQIAQAPVEPRDSSRLLVLSKSKQSWEHKRFTDLPNYFDSNDLLIANNTSVLKARLAGRRVIPNPEGGLDPGGKVEFLMLEEKGPKLWEGAFHASAKHKPGVMFEIPTPDGQGLKGKIVRGASESPSGTIVVEFDRDPVESGAGEIPLPHYVDRKATESDERWYQTVYAKTPGSAAAPTAGLHFTPRVLENLKQRGARWNEVTLHVGLGTFRPVKSPDIRQHVMHEERFWISDEVATDVNQAKKAGKRITAVGTTSVRTLESAWDSDGHCLRAGSGRTLIFLHPGGRSPQCVDRLVTNFHLPKSTLLMLVCAFAGTELTLAAYREAVKEGYRFFSFGDAMLVIE